IRWMMEATLLQWSVLLLMVAVTSLLISQGYLFVIKVRPWDQGHAARSIALLLILTGSLAGYSYFLDVRVKEWLLGFDEIAASMSGSLSLKGTLVSMIVSMLIIWIDY